MPAEIVNLNKFRKSKKRAAQERQAEQNRAKYGRTKAERMHDDEERILGEKVLDGAKLPPREAGQDHKGAHDTEADPDTGADS
ncbi:MAG: DUF4169 family protein [Hyphomicrobium sp.]|jgi:hypothetical protein|nr:DUF4169 family protein [Hyphomicrobium sp.]